MPFYNILIFSVILFNCIFFQKKAVKYFGREGKSFYLCTRFPDERGGQKRRVQAVLERKEIFEKFPYTFFLTKQ